MTILHMYHSVHVAFIFLKYAPQASTWLKRPDVFEEFNTFK